jgi:hypothetical protein
VAVAGKETAAARARMPNATARRSGSLTVYSSRFRFGASPLAP